MRNYQIRYVYKIYNLAPDRRPTRRKHEREPAAQRDVYICQEWHIHTDNTSRSSGISRTGSTYLENGAEARETACRRRLKCGGRCFRGPGM